MEDINEPAPTNGDQETKADKFKRLVNYRMHNAIKRIRQMQNLSNTSQYEYTAEQAEFVINALQHEVDTLARKFEGATEHDDIPQL